MSVACVARISSAVGMLCVVVAFRRAAPPTEAERRALASRTIRAAFAIAWPSVLLSSVDDASRPALLAPLAWNAVAWIVDSYLAVHALPAPQNRSSSPSLRYEAMSLNGLAFGLCGMLGGLKASGCSPLFLKAIAVSLVFFVLPTHDIAPDTMPATVVDAVQKGATQWCVGFLIAGVVLGAPRVSA